MNIESFNDCINECKKKYEKFSRNQLIEEIIRIDKKTNPNHLTGHNLTDKGLLVKLCTTICEKS
jgi:glycyl-tRNA synthetase (class II)